MRSLRKAINEKCKDCIYDPQNGGTWHAQVEACTARDCALWEVRPVTEATRKERAELERQRTGKPKPSFSKKTRDGNR